MSDIYRRLLELERRTLRLARSQDYVKRQQQALSQAINHPGGIGGWPVFASDGIATIYPTVQTLEVQLQSFRTFGYPSGLDAWTTLNTWAFGIRFGTLSYNGIDEPWPTPPGEYYPFTSVYSGPTMNFFNQWVTLTLQGVTNNLTANYSGTLTLTDQNGFNETYRLSADITYNNVIDTSKATLRMVSLTGFQMPNLVTYYPINIDVSTIQRVDKIAAINTTGSISADRNGTVFLRWQEPDGGTPPKNIVMQRYARNPIMAMRW